MALQLIDSLDMISAAADLSSVRGWTINGTVTFNASSGRFGGGGLNVATSNSNNFIALLPGGNSVNCTSTVIHYAFWMKLTRPSTSSFSAVILSGSGQSTLTMTINSAGDISFGAPGYSSATASAAITDANYHHVEVAYKNAGGSGGVMRLWIDGVITAINVTAGNTSGGTFTAVTTLQFLGNGNSVSMTIDDIVIWDETGTDFVSTHLDEHRIQTALPTSDSSVQFTPDTGANNYSRIDDSAYHDTDTTYVQSTTIGHKDLYGVAALPSVPTSVLAVAINTRAEKTDVGTTVMKNHVKSGATDTSGASQTLTNGYKQYTDHYGKNPTTVAAWSTSEVANMLIGFEYFS